jgi:hypothetical protein
MVKRKNQRPGHNAIDCAKKVIRRLKKAGQPVPSQAALALALHQAFFHEYDALIKSSIEQLSVKLEQKDYNDY